MQVRRWLALVASAALAAALFTPQPANAAAVTFTANTLVPGEVSGTVTINPGSYVRVAVDGLPATTSVLDATAGSASFSLSTWGLYSARLKYQLCTGPEVDSCGAWTLDQQVRDIPTVHPEVTVSGDRNYATGETIPVTVSDPDGGGDLYLFGTLLNRFGTTNVPLPATPKHATGKFPIRRCASGATSPCMDTGLTPELLIHSSALEGVLLASLVTTIGHDPDQFLTVYSNSPTLSVDWQLVTTDLTPIDGFSGHKELSNSPYVRDIPMSLDGLASGDYKVVLDTAYLNPTAGLVTDHYVTKAFSVDSVAPIITSTSLSGNQVYPVLDQYFDTIHIEATAEEPVRWSLKVVSVETGEESPYSSYVPAGTEYSAHWNGWSSGVKLPAGDYELILEARDSPQLSQGNLTETSLGVVQVVREKLYRQEFSVDSTIAKGFVNSGAGRCSSVVRPGRPGWKGSVRLVGSSKCTSRNFEHTVAWVIARVQVPNHQDVKRMYDFSTYVYGAASKPYSQAAAAPFNFRLDAYGQQPDWEILTPRTGWHFSGHRVGTDLMSEDGWVYVQIYTGGTLAYDVGKIRVKGTYFLLGPES